MPFAPHPQIDPIEIGGEDAVPLQLNFRSQSQQLINQQRQQQQQIQSQAQQFSAQPQRVNTFQFQTQSVKPRTQIFSQAPAFQTVRVPQPQPQRQVFVAPKPQAPKPVFTPRPFTFTAPQQQNFRPVAFNQNGGSFRFQKIGDSPASVSQPQQQIRTLNFGQALQAAPKPLPVPAAPQQVQNFNVRPIPNNRNLPLFVSTQPQIVLANTQQLGPAPQVSTEQLVNNVLQQVNAQPVAVAALQPRIENASAEDELSEEVAEASPAAPAPLAQPRQQQFLTARREPIRLQIVPQIRENLNRFFIAPVAQVQAQPQAQVQVQQAQVQVAQPVATASDPAGATAAVETVAAPQAFALNQGQLTLQRQVISTSEPRVIETVEIQRSNNDNLLQGIQALFAGAGRQTSSLSTATNTNLDTSLNSFIQELTAKSQSDANRLFINGDKNGTV